MIEIPWEIKNKADFPQLKKIDRQIIAVAVLLRMGNQDAFRQFHPEFLDGNGRLNDAGKQASTMFWSYGKVKDYREQLESEIAGCLGRGHAPGAVAPDIDGNRVESALKKLLNQAIGLLDRGDELDPDSVKTIVEVFRKMNLLRDEEQAEMKPIRVLPTRCKTECRYRLFCETAQAKGLIVDECDYCRARAYAEEHGFDYDPCTVLSIPAEVNARIDEQNTVTLDDIVNNKVEN